jgi:hypothetical protein
MKKAWKKIERMVREGYVHNRKHFNLSEVQPPFILGHAQDELNELKEYPDDCYELADIMGILIHYCIKQGWPMELIESTLIEKLNMRFSKPKKTKNPA